MFESDIKLELGKMVCHSGGAIGSDTEFEETSIRYGISVRAYSYKTPKHTSVNKVEISEEEYNEGIEEIKKANKILKRNGITRYMNLLSRNWMQVKNTQQIFAIGTIIKPNCYDSDGYLNKSKYDIVSGGTGYACAMGIIHEKELNVFNQIDNKWYGWSYITNSFQRIHPPTITKFNFTGIGTRKISESGIEAIRELFIKSFGKI